MNFYIQSFFNTFRYYIFIIYYRIIHLITIIYEKKIEYISPDKIYYSTILDKFQKADENNNNIDPIFYNKKEFNEFMKTQNNSLESIWKTRILIQSTPRGNIIMYYDPYKLGFSYYCDQNVISYDILNTVAMKYVMIFRCKHFFIDELIQLEDTKNPLKIHYIDENIESKSLNNNNNNQVSPFMKPKQNINQKQTPEDKLRNKFIYLGTMRNFIPCKKPEKKIVQGFVSVLLDNIDSRMNWSSYKKQMNDTNSKI